MTEPERSDEELLAESRRLSGEDRRRSVDELFSRHYARVARWCYRLTGDPDSAADLAQEVFLKAHRHFDDFHGQSKFSTWLYSIARNESADRWRRTSGAPILEGDDVLAEAPSPAPGPEHALATERRHQRVSEFLHETLDESERTVFTLHYGDDMPIDAITRLLRLDNASGAKAYLVSARRKIARAVSRVRARGERW